MNNPNTLSLNMPIKNIPPLLIRYVEKEILPLYDDFDAAHRQEHVRMVVRQSLELAQMINDGTITIDAVTYVSEPMVYVTAAYHDVGMTVNRKYHHLHSGEKVRQDRNLLQWFSPEQIEVIACAVEDHRASAKTTPRSIYGKIVSEADRYIVPEDVVLRTLQYGLENYPGLDQQGQWERTLEHLRDKYGYGGYLKLWFEAGTNYERLKSFQQMIAHDQAALREIFDKAYQQQMPSCPDQTSVYQSDAWRQMRSGEPYDATQPILIKELIRVRGLVARYNSMNPEDTEGLTRMLRQLLGGCGSNVSVVQPFRCDYGKNIFIGDNTYVNFNLTVLDEAKVTIGNNCFLGPNISIYTPCHPLNPKMRNTGQEWSLEVSIGDNCWLGGNVVVLPGVHIGNNVVIGAGSVVTKDVPDSQLWAGNPARFIKEVDTER